MPATTTKQTQQHRVHPYIKPDPEDDTSTTSSSLTSAKVEPVTPTKKQATSSTASKAASRPWSGEELKMLFQHAIKNGAPGSDGGWDGVVPGRTGGQARNAWRKRLVPGVMGFLDTAGK